MGVRSRDEGAAAVASRQGQRSWQLLSGSAMHQGGWEHSSAVQQATPSDGSHSVPLRTPTMSASNTRHQHGMLPATAGVTALSGRAPVLERSLTCRGSMPAAMDVRARWMASHAARQGTRLGLHLQLQCSWEEDRHRPGHANHCSLGTL